MAKQDKPEQPRSGSRVPSTVSGYGEGTPRYPSTGVAADAEPEGPDATEAAEQLARAEGIRLSGVKGTGAGGRITVTDVEQAAEEKG